MAGFVSLTDDDMRLYASQMEQIKARIAAASGFFQPPHIYPSVEAGILQLRLALESLVLSSLVTNRKAIQAVSTAFAKKDHGEAFKLGRQVNPEFWPVPSEQHVNPEGVMEMRRIDSGYLAEADYLPTWGRLSEWLHATNPFKSMPEPAVGARCGIDVLSKLVVLLNHHSIRLLERDEMLVCIMNESVTGQVHVFGFGRPTSEQPLSPGFRGKAAPDG